ncbi:MAG TPA: hypothetical protein VMT35_05465 [Ignavibacteriaceae bacterium]|nr:hypothetical protein [Ignavibacteriaceae bacterium]
MSKHYFLIIFRSFLRFKNTFLINISISLFLSAVAGLLAFARITVLYHSIKAAAANPVESLRYE